MTTAAELSPEAVALRENMRDCEPAVRRLLERAQLRVERAQRAPVRSNDRRKSLAEAKLMRACASQVVADKTLRAELRDKQLLAAGSSVLASAIVAFVRRKEKLR